MINKIIDIEKLKVFLSELSINQIERNWGTNKDLKLLEGNAIDDIERFGKKCYPNLKEESVIPYGGYFLVDALGNDLSICKLTKRKFKNPNGRLVRSKYILNIIPDCRKLWGDCLNGYWKIPEQFYLKSN